MRIQSLVRHTGVSFNGGPGLVHLRAANADARTLHAAWTQLVVGPGLGGPLESREHGTTVDGSAPLSPFVSLPALTAGIRAAYAGRAVPPAIADELALAAADARMYEASYGMHLREATRRGWVVQPFRLGFYPALLLGAGRHARLLAMNLPAHVSAAITLAGGDKGMARDLLAAHGLPVAAGATAGSPTAALRVARALGGPVVVKRLVGGNSDGVIVGLTAPRDITSAARRLLAGSYGVLVERCVAGTELRLHFIAGRLHAAFRAEAFMVEGDGERSLASLIGASYPRYLRTMSASAAHRRRLTLFLWPFGVRRFADIARIVPDAGQRVRVSAATGAGMERVQPTDWLAPADVARLERFFEHYGSPSGGVDVIVRAPGAPLAEGGAILELNIPCGFGYLDEPERAVAADLDAAIRGDGTFRRDRGRVPVWLMMDDEPAAVRRRAEVAMRKRYGETVVGQLGAAESNWVSLLNEPRADALLIVASEAAILAHGIPVNLAPVLVSGGNGATTRARYPATCGTVKHARGRVTTIAKMV